MKHYFPLFTWYFYRTQPESLYIGIQHGLSKKENKIILSIDVQQCHLWIWVNKSTLKLNWQYFQVYVEVHTMKTDYCKKYNMTFVFRFENKFKFYSCTQYFYIKLSYDAWIKTFTRIGSSKLQTSYFYLKKQY